MKKEIPLVAIIAAAVVLLIGISIGVKTMFFQDPNYSPLKPGSAEFKEMQDAKDKSAIHDVKRSAAPDPAQSGSGGMYRH